MLLDGFPTPDSPGVESADPPPSNLNDYSTRAIEAADLIESKPLLSKLSKLRAMGQTNTVEYLTLRQQLTERILLSMMEVSGTVAEIICERDRADQIAHRMDEIDNARVKGLTLASILAGGVAAIVSGGIGLAGGATTTSDAVEVAGGVLTSVFGGQALFIKSEHEFKHQRNLLAEIWKDPKETRLYPPTVWRFLHTKPEQSEESLRDELIKSWRQEGQLGEPGSSGEKARMKLMFGAGGVYSAVDLKARAVMLESLEAEVQKFNEYLEVLIRDLTRVR